MGRSFSIPLRLAVALALSLWTAVPCGAFDLTISLQNGAPVFSWPDLGTSKVYTVQAAGGLNSRWWQPATNPENWPVAGTSFIDAPPAGAAQFFRLAVTERARVISVDPQEVIDLATMAQLIPLVETFYGIDVPFNATYAVNTFRVTYETLDPVLGPTIASGALFVPVGIAAPADLLSYQHGTIHRRQDAPSNAGVTERIIGMIAATHGYVVAMPDYIGLGLGSTNVHPYVHRRSSATAVVDMLRAARKCVAETAVIRQDLPQGLSGKLFLFGYSQGGYVTLAAQKEIESKHAAEFPITASAPSDGPYDLSGTMAKTITSAQRYSSPNYLPYLLLTYNTVYHLFDDPAQVLVAPYATNLPPLFDGQHTGDEFDAKMPASGVPSEILRPEFLQAFRTDPNDPFRAALRQNDLTGWAPASPTRLYHCSADEVVPFANAAVAYASFVAAGADTNRVRLIDPNPAGLHGTCLNSAVPLVLDWFDSLR